MATKKERHVQEMNAELDYCAQVLNEFAKPGHTYSIPDVLLCTCEGILIRKEHKASLMAGVTRAKGFVVKRVREDVYKNCFSPPVALEATGFHVGPFDVGGTSADVVVLIFSKELMDRLAAGNFTKMRSSTTLAVVKGVQIDLGSMQALAFSRAKGVYAGVSIEATRVKCRKSLQKDWYNDPEVTIANIFSGNAKAPDSYESSLFVKALNSLPTIMQVGDRLAAEASDEQTKKKIKEDVKSSVKSFQQQSLQELAERQSAQHLSGGKSEPSQKKVTS